MKAVVIPFPGGGKRTEHPDGASTRHPPYCAEGILIIHDQSAESPLRWLVVSATGEGDDMKIAPLAAFPNETDAELWALAWHPAESIFAMRDAARAVLELPEREGSG